MSNVLKASALLDKSIYWQNVAKGENDILLMYQHHTTSLSFLKAAREFASDLELERFTGVNVSGMWSTTEAEVNKSRQIVRGRMHSTEDGSKKAN